MSESKDAKTYFVTYENPVPFGYLEPAVLSECGKAFVKSVTSDLGRKKSWRVTHLTMHFSRVWMVLE